MLGHIQADHVITHSHACLPTGTQVTLPLTDPPPLASGVTDTSCWEASLFLASGYPLPVVSVQSPWPLVFVYRPSYLVACLAVLLLLLLLILGLPLLAHKPPLMCIQPLWASVQHKS